MGVRLIMSSFSEKSLEIIKKNAEADNNEEVYTFLNFAVNLQSLHQYSTLSQFKSKYLDAIENQIQRQQKKK